MWGSDSSSGDFVTDTLNAYKPWLMSVAKGIRMSGSIVDTDDVFQVGWLAMWKALRIYDPQEGPMDLWLKAKARWAMKDLVSQRRASRDQESIGVDPGYDVDAASQPVDVDLALHYREIYKAVRGLSEKQREYIFLRFWEDYSYSQLMEHFGGNPSSLWVNHGRGVRDKLREELAHLEPVG